jgi:predicted PurR-regulated permease PerM
LTAGQWFGLVVLVISIYIFWQIRQALLLAFTAVVIATVLNRVVRRLERSGMKRSLAVPLTMVGVLVVLALFIAVIVPPFVNQFQQLIELLPQGIEEFRGWLNRLQNFVPASVLERLRGTGGLIPQIQDLVGRLFDNFLALFANTLSVVLSALLVTVLTIMLLAEPSKYRWAFMQLFPSSRRVRISEVLDKCDEALSGWAIGILFNMTVIAVFSGMGLWILGVRLPLANGLLAGLLTYIPNIGPTLSVIPPAVLALLDAPWKALAVLVLYIAIQQIESNILTPLVMQRQVSMLPAITLLSLVVFGIFFGILGLILALPIAVVAEVLLKELLIKDFLNKR